MGLKAVTTVVLTMLLIGTLTLASNIQPVKAWTGGTIRIKADGSVDPPTAPISNVKNIIYTLTDNILYNLNEGGAIVVERDNIVLDGADHTLRGPGYTHLNSYGIFHSATGTHTNITIRNLEITNFGSGFHLYNSFDIIISGNDITYNWDGIRLYNSSGNTISGNDVTEHDYGIVLDSSSNNRIFHNNFIDNSHHTDVSAGCTNTWDDGYPSGGNYWSDHSCNGNPSDGSQPYIIDENNEDHYPFQDPIGWPQAVGGIWVPVDKLGLLAPYIGLASTIIVATATTAVYVKRVRRRK